MLGWILVLCLSGCTPDPTPPPTAPPATPAPEPVTPRAGRWRAWLDSPGGELPFGLDLSAGNTGWQAWILNGDERLAVDAVAVEGCALVLDIAHYDARIEARCVDADPEHLTGTWSKTKSGGRTDRLPFTARVGRARRFSALSESGPAGSVAGRWRVDFPDGRPAVALLAQDDGAEDVTGTILTAVGDYRYLAGSLEGSALRLSTFDGAHAFLFHARLDGDRLVDGQFWSGSAWNEVFTAHRDPEARLPDPLGLSRVADDVAWGALAFPDLEGRERRLDDPEWSAGPRLVQVMGTWCPNCNDQTELLAELLPRYADRGLSVVSLAFEYSGSPERDRRQVARYKAHHQTTWTYLVAGISDKDAASAALPILDRVVAYPTLLFVDREGTVRAVLTGFTGPAAPAEHAELKATIERLVDGIVASG